MVFNLSGLKMEFGRFSFRYQSWVRLRRKATGSPKIYTAIYSAVSVGGWLALKSSRELFILDSDWKLILVSFIVS